MQFSTVRALVGWAFQMTEAIPVKVQKFAEPASRAFSDLTKDERHMLAIDVMAKVGRLDAADQVVLTAYFTGTTAAIREAAKLLPVAWPTALRRELARGWAGDVGLQRTQHEIGQKFLLSQQTVANRWHDTQSLLNDVYHHGLKIIEIQVSDLLLFSTYRNANNHAGLHEILAF